MPAKLTADKWEAAWATYVECLEAYESTRHDVSRRSTSGHTRQHRGNVIRLRKAIVQLRKLDGTFCDNLGIRAR